MSAFWDIFKELFPPIKDSIKGGITGFRTAKRNRQDVFVLKAMARLPDDHFMPPTEYPRCDLYTISNWLRRSQYEEAFGLLQGGDRMWLPTPTRQEEDEVVKQLKIVERRFGLPGLRDPERARKVEEILHRMVRDNKLRYHPPNMWSII
jgi:hypothetical protein